MPQASLVDLMEEMAEALRTAFTGSDVPVQVEPLLVINPTPPSVDIYPGDPFSDDISAGFGDITGQLILTVRARVDTADSEAGQQLLLAMMDDQDDLSVAGALMDDQTLNGLASSVHAEGPSGYQQYVDPGSQGSFLGCSWRVTVLRAFS